MRAPLRILGLFAIAGGALRVVDSFTTRSFSPATLALLYFVTDVLLLLGIFGVYWSQRSKLGVAGVIGLGIFAVGIVLIRISAFGVFGANGYQLGAAIAVLGLAIYSAEELLRRDATNVTAILWLATLAFGLVGAMGVMAPLMTIAAGVAFGTGFVLAGRNLLAL